MERTRITGAVVLAAALALAFAAARPASADDAPATTSRMEVPLRLALEGEVRGDGAVLTATLAVRGRLRQAPVLRVRLPEGATLVEGAAEEALVAPPAGGEIVRTFRVRGLAGRPVTVTADLATRSAGAHAEASWPSDRRARLAAPAPRGEPIRPVQVHGVRIDRAIPLAPAPKAP